MQLMLLNQLYVTILVFLGFVMCSDVPPPGYVLLTYNAIGLLNRDNSTGVDTVNFLRCLYNSGLKNSVDVAISRGWELTLIVDYTAINKTLFDKTVVRCNRLVGFGIMVGALGSVSEYDDDVRVVLDIQSARNAEPQLFAEVSRFRDNTRTLNPRILTFPKHNLAFNNRMTKRD